MFRVSKEWWMMDRDLGKQHFSPTLRRCLSGAVHGAEQDLSRSLTAWSVCPDTFLVSASHPTSLEGPTLTDSGVEKGPCSELSWVWVLIFPFVSPGCGEVEAGWNDSLGSEVHSSQLTRTGGTVAPAPLGAMLLRCCIAFRAAQRAGA